VLLALGFPVLVGASRKRFLGTCSPTPTARRRPPAGRDTATAVITGLAADRGAWGVRVHDVASSMDAVAVATAWHLGASRARNCRGTARRDPRTRPPARRAGDTPAARPTCTSHAMSARRPAHLPDRRGRYATALAGALDVRLAAI
jgi:hypothetical protein